MAAETADYKTWIMDPTLWPEDLGQTQRACHWYPAAINHQGSGRCVPDTDGGQLDSKELRLG